MPWLPWARLYLGQTFSPAYRILIFRRACSPTKDFMAFPGTTRLLSLAAALFVLLFSARTLAQTCYYPDKSIAQYDVPCNASASASACCGSGSWCLDNGLCLDYGSISRGSCTDESWQSTECCPYCQNGISTLKLDRKCARG
jgi:hypothetical protein